MSAHPHRARGMTLLEVLVAIAVLAIIAAVSVPSLSSTDPYPLDFAAQEVASALRFARSEAIRTGEAHGVLLDPLDNEPLGEELTVYKVDLAPSPFGFGSFLYHPVRKQVYAIRISHGPLTPHITIISPGQMFQFSGLANLKRNVHFDATGAPVYFKDSAPYRLISSDIRLSDGKDQRVVLLQPITGRVTVQ